MMQATANLSQRLASALARRERVHVATTERERRAIFRMRYETYVGELGYPVREADAAKREIATPEDDLAESTLFYTGTPENVTASVRVRTWEPGKIPREVHRQFSLERFADIDTRTICLVSMLIARRDLRGTGRVLALVVGSAEHTVRRHRVDAMLASCVPALLPGYQRLGLRPYGGRLFSAVGSMDVPLIGVLQDMEHMRRVGSAFYPAFCELKRRGQYPVRDASPLLPPLADTGIETDPRRVTAEIEARSERLRSTFLMDIPEDARRRLLRGGMVMEVPAGVDVFEPGVVCRDLFVVLEGAVDVRGAGRADETIGEGGSFGEGAFLLDDGRHTVGVTTRGACKLLHLRHGFVQRLMTERPADAAAFHRALARELARRPGLRVADAREPQPAANAAG